MDGATSVSATGTDLGTWYDPRRASLFIDESDVVGIENPKSLLIRWLTEGEEKLTAISVVGMGGLGKTTLVKKAYDSQPVRKYFDCHSWITVSTSFTAAELLQAALKGFLEATQEPAPEGIDTMGDLQLVYALRGHLQDKRYLVVFDDVWSINAWEAVKYALPECSTGSRIIFTTRLNDLAASIEIIGGHVYHLQALPDEEAWRLFCMKAFRGEHKGVCPEELKDMSLSILKKCRGLPLAIVTIGGLLSKKNKVILEWKKVHDSLAAEVKTGSSFGSLRRILLLSYDDLPYHLKICYLYLSIFPEDYLIKRKKLIRLWVAERFVEEKDGLTMEQVAEDYLDELVSRSMVQAVEVNDFNKVRTCRVHDLMREIIQSKSREEVFVYIFNEKGKIIDEKVRHITIHNNCENFPQNTNMGGLRSLLLFVSEYSSAYFQRSFFHGSRKLRVLELDLAPISDFPLELVELIHLRYLSLRMTLIKELPESIEKLSSLEILDLKGTLISTLPIGILKLKRLVQLQSYRYRFKSSIFLADTYGISVPNAGIGCLSNLQKLKCIEVDQGSQTLQELGKLIKLKSLGILKLRRKDETDLCSSLEKMKDLISLYMVSIADGEVLQLDSLLSPPEYLQRLYLKCSLSNLPKWIALLRHLAKLVLQYSNLKSDPLKALQDLPNLVVLELRLAYNGEELCCEASGYPRLKKLCLFQLEQLKSVSVVEGAMPGLKKLDVSCCQELEMVPSGIEHMRNLKELHLLDMPQKFLKKIERSQGEDFWKVQHILTIKHVCVRRGRWTVETLY